MAIGLFIQLSMLQIELLDNTEYVLSEKPERLESANKAEEKLGSPQDRHSQEISASVL
jgi:hypothetical protein